MHRLASYDIRKPTEVILSFNDSDDERSTNSDFDEDTSNNNLSKDIKTSKAVFNNHSETCKTEVKSNTQKPNDPNTIKCRENYLNDKNLCNKSEKQDDHPPTKLRKITMEIETIEEKKQYNLDKKNFLECLKKDYSESSAIFPEKNDKKDSQKAQELCNEEPLPDIGTQGSPSNEANEFVYINKVLHRVSESLLLIIKAFSVHLLIQNQSKEQNQIDASMANFLRLKYQLFKLCFVTVENIMVSNASNEEFIRQFVIDTIKLGNESNITCTQQQIKQLLTELLTWTAEKKNVLHGTCLTIEEILQNHKLEPNKPTFNQNHMKQNENAEKPPRQPNVDSFPIWVDTTKDTNNTMSKWKVNSDMPQSHTNIIAAPSTNSMPTVHTNNDSLIQVNHGIKPNNVTTDPANNGPLTVSNNIVKSNNVLTDPEKSYLVAASNNIVKSNNVPTEPAISVTASNNISAISMLHDPLISPPHGHINLAPRNNGPAASPNNSTKKTANNYATCKVIVNNDLAKVNDDMALKSLEDYVNLNSLSEKPTSNVIFSSGPPGQQVSITIDHSVLKQQLQLTNVNLTPYNSVNSAIIQNLSNSHQQQEIYAQSSSHNWHQVQLPPKQLHQQQLPQQKLPQQQLPQPQLPQQKWPQKQLTQQQLPQQQLPSQQFPQRQTALQHLLLQPVPQQYLHRNHAINQRNHPPPSYDSGKGVFTQLQQADSNFPRNALPQNKGMPPSYWQHQSQMVPNSTHQHPHPLHSYRTPEQNVPRAQLEITRSSSNDSGFTSPLNFNSPAPTNTQVLLF